jgi:hypothetical protein
LLTKPPFVITNSQICYNGLEAVVRQLDIVYTTMIAELLDRTLDAQFDADFDESGLFRKRPVKGREYWYYKASERGAQTAKDIYVGPADDPEINRRVENFAQIKDDYQKRRKIVSTLTREARLFSPEPRVGNIVEAFWKAGLFRLRACLVGTIAYQTYGAVLGCRLAGAAMQTGDIDLAQFHSISVAVDDSIPPVLDVLRSVDESFKPAPHLNDAAGATKYVGANGLRVDFLTPNRGSDDLVGKPAKMPSLGGAAAEPLRFLDFLIYEPVRTVMLHKGGIPVLVPDPCRFAVHKMIVAARRSAGSQKDLKDLGQANQLAEALKLIGRAEDLREMFQVARDRGSSWREALDASLARMEFLGLSSAPSVLKAA